MKVFRRLTEGNNPEEEITRFLTECTGFRGSPRLAGALAYDAGTGTPATVAVVQEFIADGVDGWRWMLDRLAAGDPTLDALRRLGGTTAGLHRALATPAGDPAFDPEPATPADVAAWAEAVGRQVALAREAAPAHAWPDVGDSLAAAGGLGGLVGTDRIRHHGDFHLGQVLRVNARDAFVIIDFEGEPLRPLAERRRKHSPLRDVAGMLRSLAYAAETARAADAARGARLQDWERAARAAFVQGYLDAARPAAFLPGDEQAFHRAVAVFELEKAAYEVVYEADHRPDWIDIPLRGVAAAARTLRAT
jgi:maltose alpha-D-glucosyltransferase/alpha-amylase